jgi:outer membrane immunogenic protein
LRSEHGDGSVSALSTVNGTSSACFTPNFKCQNQINNLLLVNGRLGYAFGPLLLYGTGGYARAQVEGLVTELSLLTPNEHVRDDASGWDAGGGIEYMFTHNVSIAVQYVHVALNSALPIFAEPTESPRSGRRQRTHQS